MTEEQVTSPDAAPEPEPPTEVTPETQEAVEGQQPPEGGEDAPIEGQTDQATEPDPEPDTVEVEINGSKYHVPKDLEDSFLMHADYTRKTQETAEERRALQSEKDALKQTVESHQQQAETHRQNLQDYGQLSYVDAALQQFRGVNWTELQEKDPEKAQEMAFQFQMVRDQREQIVERLQKREQETRLQMQRDSAKRQEHLKATLARDIPNYSPELQAKMTETALRHGFSREEVEGLVDPRAAKVLHLAYLGEQVLKRQAAATKPKPKPVKPVPKATGGPAPDTSPKDDQGIDAWMRSRNQQLDKRRQA